jgi:hypothetical protein
MAAFSGLLDGGAHNFLLAPTWALLVPRSRRVFPASPDAAATAGPSVAAAAEEAAWEAPPSPPPTTAAAQGMSREIRGAVAAVDVNGLGFLGCLLVRGPSTDLPAPPSEVLRGVAFPWP